MANKDEYFMRIIASLQSEITSLKTGQSEAIKEIKTLKSTVDRQQKEIEALKASQGTPQKSSDHQQKWITTENMLLAVKRVCDDVIRSNNAQQPTVFADRQEFDTFCKLAEQKFLSVDTFNDYRKSVETRLKSFEEKVGQGFCLFAINFYNQKREKGYRSILKGLKNLKDIEIEGLFPFVVLLVIVSPDIFLISSIRL